MGGINHAGRQSIGKSWVERDLPGGPTDFTSSRNITVNHVPDWVKSTNVGSKPILNQFRSRRSPSSEVSTVCHRPLSAQENRLLFCLHPVIEREITPPSVLSSFGNLLNSTTTPDQTRSSVVRNMPAIISIG